MDDVRFLRYGAQQTDGQMDRWTDGWKKWHIGVNGESWKNLHTSVWKSFFWFFVHFTNFARSHLLFETISEWTAFLSLRFVVTSSRICSTTTFFTYHDFLQPALVFLLSCQADLSFFLRSKWFALASFFLKLFPFHWEWDCCCLDTSGNNTMVRFVNGRIHSKSFQKKVSEH